MKPIFIFAVVVFVANMSTATMLFLDAPSNPSIQPIGPLPTVEIKWGDG